MNLNPHPCKGGVGILKGMRYKQNSWRISHHKNVLLRSGAGAVLDMLFVGEPALRLMCRAQARVQGKQSWNPRERKQGICTCAWRPGNEQSNN